MKQTLEYYRSLPYTRRAEGIHEADGPPYWVAWIGELSGCKTDGATYAEAMANLDVAFDDYIEALLEFGSDISLPEPIKSTPKIKDTPEVVESGQDVMMFVEPDDVEKTAESTQVKRLRLREVNKQWVSEEEPTTTAMEMAPG